MKDNDFAVFDTVVSQMGFPSNLSDEERNSYFNMDIPLPHMVGTEIINTVMDINENVPENTLQEVMHLKILPHYKGYEFNEIVFTAPPLLL